MTSTRTRALQAAVELVGTAGLRALTHGRVDERAGLPKGSTSNYFRTRAALLSGVVDWIVEQELQTVRPAFSPATPEELVDVLCALIDITTGPNRTFTTARLILFLEASHNPTLRERLSQGRAVMEDSIVQALEHLGARDARSTATALMACAEGVILHRIARHDPRDVRDLLRTVVRGAMP